MEHLTAAVERLAEQVKELSKKADTTEKVLARIEGVATDTRHNRTGLRIATVGICMNLALTAFCGYLFYRVDQYAHEVRAVQERTSSEILCPLYQVFALSIKVNPAPTTYTSEQLELRQHAADTILAGLDKLGCR